MDHLATTFLLLAAAALSWVPCHALSLTQFLTQRPDEQQQQQQQQREMGSGHQPLVLHEQNDDLGIPEAAYKRSLDGLSDETVFSPYSPVRHQSSRRRYKTQITPFVLLNLIRLVLYEHDFMDPQVDNVISDIVTRLGSDGSQPDLKRSLVRNRIPIQARVSPFGTKISPNRNNDKNGGTLLRYGRSVL